MPNKNKKGGKKNSSKKNKGPKKGKGPAKQGKDRRIGNLIREVGTMAGNAFGQPVLGTAAGNVISKIMGYGDYRIKANSLLTSGGPPQFGSLRSGFRVKHREFITDLQATSAFSTKRFQINPGMADLFPWLNTVARNFEEYKIHGLVVYLNSTSAVAVSSTNTALGVWGVVTVYDPNDPTLASKQECENYIGCQTSKPCESLLHGIECAPKSNVMDQLYVRTGQVTDDLKFYDKGFVQYFTTGAQATSTAGELWVSYDIEFFKPKLPQGSYDVLTGDITAYFFTGATPFPAVKTTGVFNNSTLDCYCQNNTLAIKQQGVPTTFVVVVNCFSTAGYGAVTYDGSNIAVTRGSMSPNPFELPGAVYQVVLKNNTSQLVTFMCCVNVDAGTDYTLLTFGSFTGSVVQSTMQALILTYDSDVLDPKRIAAVKHEEEEDKLMNRILSRLRKLNNQSPRGSSAEIIPKSTGSGPVEMISMLKESYYQDN